MAELLGPNIFIFLLIIISLTGMVNSFPNAFAVEQIMKQGDSLSVGFKKDFQNGRCRVAMKARGAIEVLKGAVNKKLMWQTGMAPGHVLGDQYKLELKETGNLVIERIASADGPIETVTVYNTHSEEDVGDYFLAFNKACLLELWKGTMDDPVYIVWSNIHWEMGSGDTLGVSEVFFDRESYSDDYFMFMNPNGNLEIYEGKDFSAVGNNEPVWESGTKRQRGDYRFIVGERSVLSLLDVATGEQYWKKEMRNSGRPSPQQNWLSLVSSGYWINDNGIGPYEWFISYKNGGDVFMKEGDKLPAGSAHASFECNLFVQYDGRLDVIDNMKTKWSSGKAKGDTTSSEYFLMLHDTGNLVMYRGTVGNNEGRLWATHTKGDKGNYFLFMGQGCDLEIFEGTPEEKGKQIWSNRVTKLRSGDRLIRAQYFTPEDACNGHFMTLLPDTGMLAIYDSKCLSESFYEDPECFEDPEWSFDTGLGGYDDFYMKVGDGKLQFYGISGSGDVLMNEKFELGKIDGDFEVTLCDESGLVLPNSIKIAV